MLCGKNMWAQVKSVCPSLLLKLHPRNISWEQESGHSLLPFMNLTATSVQGGAGATPKTPNCTSIGFIQTIFPPYLPRL